MLRHDRGATRQRHQQPGGAADAELLAEAAPAARQGETIALLLGARDALNEATGYVPHQRRRAAVIDAATDQLGPATYAAAWGAGRSGPLEEIMDEVVAMPLVSSR